MIFKPFQQHLPQKEGPVMVALLLFSLLFCVLEIIVIQEVTSGLKDKSHLTLLYFASFPAVILALRLAFTSAHGILKMAYLVYSIALVLMAIYPVFLWGIYRIGSS